MAASAAEIPDMTGKTVLVTGASSGIGRVAALRLASAGARVLVHGRSPERTAAVAGLIGAEPLVADFASLNQVRLLAERVRALTGTIDVMLHNAGAIVGRRVITEDGHELTFQANHLAPFLLQRLLEPVIVATPGSRVVVVASKANRYGHVDLEDLEYARRRYRPMRAYAASKLENVLFVRELSLRLKGTGTASMAVHPGDVATAFGAGTLFPGVFYRLAIKRLYLIAAEEGAQPLIRLATMPDPCSADGLYYDRMRPRGKASPQADDPRLARGLWERSEEMVSHWL